jgi:mono/diheme cytochrome c family protein
MGSPRRLSSIASFALLSLILSVAGCGSDGDVDPYESATTRAIREKVEANMERERLQNIGKRLASLNETLANTPNAFMLAASTSTAGEDESAGAGATGLERGQASYTQYCASCHGLRGEGDGPVAASLVPQPAKHADGTYMNPLSNEHLFTVIQKGGLAIGKSSMMAPWGSTLSDEQIRDVIEFLRSLADPPYTGTTR